MKQMIQQLDKVLDSKQLTTLAIVCLLSLVIGLGGPYIAVANITPLAQLDKRCYLILVLFLSWFLRVYFFSDTPADDLPTAQGPAFIKRLRILEGRFHGAIQFLKKTIINKQGKNLSLHHLPWYLLIGPVGAGKTTLLANANVNFILAKQFKHDMIPPSETCDWWVTRDLVLLDVPGSLTHSKHKSLTHNTEVAQQPALIHHRLWKSFLDLLKKYRGTRAVAGIIIAFPFPELMLQKHQQKESILLELKQSISDLKLKFGNHLPCYLVLTKCDLIPGFSDFFCDSTSDELAQAWGITLPPHTETQQLLSAFTNRFNALIKRLNKQLLWRIHQTKNPAARPHIKDFPLQIERVKKNILGLLKNLANTDTSLQVQGVYLTSAVQSILPEKQNTYEASTQEVSLSQITRDPVMPSKAYFIRQLLLQGFPDHHPHSLHFSFEMLKRPLAYAVSIVALILTTLLFSQHGMKQTYATAQRGLTVYANAVHRMQQKIVQISNSHTASVSQSPQQVTDSVSQQPLQAITLPQVQAALENYLQSVNDKKPEDIYAALKAYLMLGNKVYAQPDVMMSALKQIAPAPFDYQNVNAFADSIRAVLSSGQAVEINATLVANARQQLARLSSVELGYAILKTLDANYTTYQIPLGIHSPTSSLFMQDTIDLPSLFTADKFNTIFTQQINIAAAEATQDNWILGTAAVPQNPASLAAQLRTLYVAYYVAAWENLLGNIQLAEPTNLAQFDTMVIQLTDDNSQLLQLLALVKQNTGLPQILAASPKLTQLNQLLSPSDHEQNNVLYKSFIALRLMHTHFQRILDKHNTTDDALQLATTHIKQLSDTAPQDKTQDVITQLHQLAQNSPEPLKSWLTQLANQSWHFIIQEATRYAQAHNVSRTTHNQLRDA
jgi:type VI secretion system protein ImpL